MLSPGGGATAVHTSWLDVSDASPLHAIPVGVGTVYVASVAPDAATLAPMPPTPLPATARTWRPRVRRAAGRRGSCGRGAPRRPLGRWPAPVQGDDGRGRRRSAPAREPRERERAGRDAEPVLRPAPAQPGQRPADGGERQQRGRRATVTGGSAARLRSPRSTSVVEPPPAGRTRTTRCMIRRPSVRTTATTSPTATRLAGSGRATTTVRPAAPAPSTRSGSRADARRSPAPRRSAADTARRAARPRRPPPCARSRRRRPRPHALAVKENVAFAERPCSALPALDGSSTLKQRNSLDPLVSGREAIAALPTPAVSG